MPQLFDLHCDTLTALFGTPAEETADLLNDPARDLSIGKMPAGTKWAQCFAIFVPDDQRGGDAVAFFDHYAAAFHRCMERHRDKILPCRSCADMENAFRQGKFAGILTVEGGAALAGRLERVKALHDAGVRTTSTTGASRSCWGSPKSPLWPPTPTPGRYAATGGTCRTRSSGRWWAGAGSSG